VRAASVNPLDWHFMRGTPYVARAALGLGLSRPKAKGLGADMAGQVGAVGKDVTEFRPGDEVFGSRSGTFAEYVSMPEDGVVLAKPANRGWHPGSSSRAIPR
jgi:NADPH:quinone reductase-like Zn-dependent oxidoreductase